MKFDMATETQYGEKSLTVSSEKVAICDTLFLKCYFYPVLT